MNATRRRILVSLLGGALFSTVLTAAWAQLGSQTVKLDVVYGGIHPGPPEGCSLCRERDELAQRYSNRAGYKGVALDVTSLSDEVLHKLARAAARPALDRVELARTPDVRSGLALARAELIESESAKARSAAASVIQAELDRRARARAAADQEQQRQQQERWEQLQRQRLEQERKDFVPLRAAMREAGVDYVVFGGTNTPPKRIASNAVAIPGSEAPGAPDPHPLAILGAPELTAKYEGDRPHLLHPSGGEALSLRSARSVLPEPWKQVGRGIWLVNVSGLDGDQAREVCQLLREVEPIAKVRTYIVTGEPDYRARVAAFPLANSSMLLTCDESIQAVAQDGALLFSYLQLLREQPPVDSRLGPVRLLLGHEEPDTSPLDRWTARARAGEFAGSHLIASICNVRPKEMRDFARLAIHHGALTVVIANAEVDVPASVFAATRFLRGTLPSGTTSLDIWARSFAETEASLCKCLGPAYDSQTGRLKPSLAPGEEQQAVKELRTTFHGLSEYLIRDDRLNRARVNQLLAALRTEPSRFNLLGKGHSPYSSINCDSNLPGRDEACGVNAKEQWCLDVWYKYSDEPQMKSRTELVVAGLAGFQPIDRGCLRPDARPFSSTSMPAARTPSAPMRPGVLPT